MPDEPEVIDGHAEPMPEATEAIEDFLPSKGDLTVSDPSDTHAALVAVDAHDIQMMLQRAQSSALKKWVYRLPDGTMGLTVDAVQDLTQQFNWMGKARLGLIPETLEVERITEDMGNGPEPLWVATIFAIDEMTGARLPGTSMEPVYMQLKDETARKWRAKGKSVPEDNRVFDVFSRTKAINKAYRNALAAFIPEEIEQTIIAMAAKDPSRVQRIQTEAEAKVAEMPAPLDDDRAKALISEAQAVYDRIRELGGGQGKVKLTPGTFSSWMLRSQHDHGALERFVAYLREREEQIPVELEREAQEREALESAVKVECPKCGVQPRDFCKGIRGSHGERIQARLEQIQGAS